MARLTPEGEILREAAVDAAAEKKRIDGGATWMRGNMGPPPPPPPQAQPIAPRRGPGGLGIALILVGVGLLVVILLLSVSRAQQVQVQTVQVQVVITATPHVSATAEAQAVAQAVQQAALATVQAQTAATQAAATPTRDDASLVASILPNFPSGSSIYFHDLRSDSTLVRQPDMTMNAGGTIYAVILAATYDQVGRGVLSWNTTRTLQRRDIVGGTGQLQYSPVGTTLTMRNLVTALIGQDDNVAANLLMDQLGINNVNSFAASLGMTHTRVRRHLMDLDAYNRGINNDSTAGDMGLLFTKLALGQVVSPSASNEMLGLLTRNTSNNVDFLGKSLAPRPQIAHIGGILETDDNTPEFHHDAGVFYVQGKPRYVLAAFTASSARDRRTVLSQIAASSASIWQALSSSNT